MIEAVDQELMQWAGEVLPSAEIRLDAPAAQHGAACACLYLMGLRPAPPVQHVRRAPLGVTLVYLVSTWSDDTAAAHQMLGQLLFAAMGHDRFEIDLEGITAETWHAFGIPPRPAFLLRAPAALERPQALQRVTGRLTLRPVPAVPFTGILLGPGDRPIPGARVTLAGLDIHTTTDNAGRFRFAAVPPGRAAKRLLIEAKGLELETSATPPAEPLHEPVIIRFTALEV